MALVFPMPGDCEQLDVAAHPVARVLLADRQTRSLVTGVLCTLGFDVVNEAQENAHPLLLVADEVTVREEAFRPGNSETSGIFIGDPHRFPQALPEVDWTVLSSDADAALISTTLRRAAAKVGLRGLNADVVSVRGSGEVR